MIGLHTAGTGLHRTRIGLHVTGMGLRRTCILVIDPHSTGIGLHIINMGIWIYTKGLGYTAQA